MEGITVPSRDRIEHWPLGDFLLLDHGRRAQVTAG
jgi:hypothetical protein